MERGKCKLCGLEEELRNSHLIPARIYRRTRSPGAKIQDPVVVTEKGAYSSSEQLTDYVFCDKCEERFNDGGENYVQRLVSTKTSFPLLDQLGTSPGTMLGTEWCGYTERDTPGIDRNAIAYFTLSVFWRASVHRWKWRDGRITTIDMGHRYSEEARRYLMGEAPFPTNITLFVVACTDKMTQDLFFMPTGTGRLEGGSWGCSFGARGIAFMMTVGRPMPPYARRLCAISSPEQWIWTRDSEERTMQALGRIILEQPVQKRATISSRA